MVSINPVTSINLHQRKVNQNKPIVPVSNAVVLSAQNPNLLENVLTAMGSQNKSIVSFGYAPTKHGNPASTFMPFLSLAPSLVKPYGQDFNVNVFTPTISDYAKYNIETEASKRINGEYPWPQIKNINAWMVSSETTEFKSDGGMGQVAADLPNSFNNRFLNDPNNKMSVITPMYVNGNEYRLEETPKGKFIYHYGRRGEKTREVKYKGTINVPIYFKPPHNTRLEDVDVRVFTCNLNEGEGKKATPHIFLEIPKTGKDSNGKDTKFSQIFNILDKDHKSSNHNTPYANSEFADPVYRMAFFSKAVYELMKSIKEGDFKGIKAPNVLLLNDWQAGPLAAMLRYTANAEADSGAISKKSGKYFEDIPAIYIAHNCEHQGSTSGNNDNRTSIFGTLFGAYGVEILPRTKSWDMAPKGEESAIMRGYDFNSLKTGVTLADRVVPVSENYGQELIHSNEKARGLMDLMKARMFAKTATLTPITNGYTKALVVPNKQNMEALQKRTIQDLTLSPQYLNKLKSQGIEPKSIDFKDFKLLPYDENNLENKVKNKNTIMNLFKQVIEREKSLPYKEESGSRPYMIFEAENTNISETDFSNVPVIAYSGRVDFQKGLDSIFKEAFMKYAQKHENDPKEKLPIFIIGGAISNYSTYVGLKALKNWAKSYSPDLADRIILINGYLNTNLVATAADLFLVPSVFEPCGLTQMEAMAKGAVPIATSTGGLVSTIKDNVDGFRTKVFFDESGNKDKLYGDNSFDNNYDAYCEAMERAIDIYNNDKEKFKEMQRNGMRNDFSWDLPGGALDKYISLMRTGKIA